MFCYFTFSEVHKVQGVILVFYHNFIALCRERNLSPSAAVTKMGISRAAITRWSTGSIPHKYVLHTIADFFGVSVDDLLKDEPEEMEPSDVRMIGRASKKMTPEDREHLLKYMKFMFPEAFDE